MNPSDPQTFPSVPKGMEPGGAGGGAPSFPTFPSQPGGGSSAPPTPGGAPSLPGVPAINRKQFITNYANMVAKTWVDDSYRQLLLRDPVNTLTAAGIPTVPGAQVIVVENKITGVGKVEDEVDAWIEGNQTGKYLLWLPIKPDDVNLSGGGPDSAEGGWCCCCTPCCSCT
jgi:hypothetical protein